MVAIRLRMQEFGMSKALDWDLLRTFAAIVRAGGLTAAALADEILLEYVHHNIE